MDGASVKVLANSGGLDEDSNGDDGSMIEQRILMAGSQGGLVKDGVTRKSVLFVIYQTGRYDRRVVFVLRWCWMGRGWRKPGKD